MSDMHAQHAGATVRPACLQDVPEMVALSEQKRLEYATYQPVFWAPAPDANARQRVFFEQLVQDDQIITLVHEEDGVVDGFIIARLVAAPPVYAPGGLTCTIDDFAVQNPSEWRRVGKALVEAAAAQAHARGAVQTVVVCGQRDTPKREMLQQLGFSIASEWWVQTH